MLQPWGLGISRPAAAPTQVLPGQRTPLVSQTQMQRRHARAAAVAASPAADAAPTFPPTTTTSNSSSKQGRLPTPRQRAAAQQQTSSRGRPGAKGSARPADSSQPSSRRRASNQALADVRMTPSQLRAAEYFTPGSPLYRKPSLVRVDGAKSSVLGAATSVVERFKYWMDQVLRVVAVDSGSLVKALAVLRTATYRLQRNQGHMLVVQPTLIGRKAADGEDVPVGATLFYTQAIRAGEVLTDNQLLVVKGCDPAALAPAIIARICTRGHTVLECYGAAAAQQAVLAVAEARKGLLTGGRDVSMLITTVDEPAPSSKDGSASTSSSAPDAAAEAAGGSQQLQQQVDPTPVAGVAAGGSQPTGDVAGAATASSSSSSSSSSGAGEGDGGSSSSSAAGAEDKGYPARREGKIRAHRFILLQCYPREPARLLVRSSKAGARQVDQGGRQAAASSRGAAGTSNRSKPAGAAASRMQWRKAG